ncbi:ABC transporter ATP-binding protein [Leptolyngbya sp. 'hensonii']|uniref:ABC transporter ATP-binding protein n=1 Tax=Leptolyngbya sp. 'hensonii' TaxID=1922337 RepID=UPI0009FB70B6|nr:ABC transporter ATP-binding protein [Leptolyngbya sp. 'hensonii']
MSETAIRVENLSKQYILGQRVEQRRCLQDVMVESARNLVTAFNPRSGRRRAGKKAPQDVFWALQDVSFEVNRGDRIGIIGRNGAGKSTLLKILSQITEPTEGRVSLKGRVASLLEVGTGFHPELTGRENILLNGAILGMSKAEIRRKFDEIVAFAEVERFLDTPVKRYSSGMYIRLAFAVAAHLEPEILVVDEVLAVGDVAFQKKCLGKMEDVATNEGRTLIFVSHDMNAIRTLCNSVVHLRSGQVAGMGDPTQQVNDYLSACQQAVDLNLQQAVPLCDTLQLQQLDFSPNPVVSGEPIDFQLAFTATKPTLISELKLMIYSATGVRVAIVDLRQSDTLHRMDQHHPLHLQGTIQGLPFVEGDYHIGLYINSPDVNNDFLDLTKITVQDAPNPRGVIPYPTRFRGFVELDFEFSRRYQERILPESGSRSQQPLVLS